MKYCKIIYFSAKEKYDLLYSKKIKNTNVLYIFY